MSNDAMREALERIKALVVGPRYPRWDRDDQVTHMRGMIADLCDSALAAPAQSATKVMPQNLTPEMRAAMADAAREYMQRTGGNSPDVMYEAAYRAAPCIVPAQSEAKPVYQYRMQRGAWEEDVWHDTYYEDYMRAQGESHIESRILYTAPSAAPAQSEAKPVYPVYQTNCGDAGWEDVDIAEYEEWGYKKRIVYLAAPSAAPAQHTHRFAIDPSSDEPRCVVCGGEPESVPADDSEEGPDKARIQALMLEWINSAPGQDAKAVWDQIDVLLTALLAKRGGAL